MLQIRRRSEVLLIHVVLVLLISWLLPILLVSLRATLLSALLIIRLLLILSLLLSTIRIVRRWWRIIASRLTCLIRVLFLVKIPTHDGIPPSYAYECTYKKRSV